jgi:colicin import membrane protein
VKELAIKKQQEAQAKELAIKKQQEAWAKELAVKKQQETLAKAEALKTQQEAQEKELALKKQQEATQAQKQADLAAAQQKQAELTAQQDALQQQFLQQQIASEQQQLIVARQMQGIIDQFRARILMAIGNQWLIPEGADPTISCVFTINLTPEGVVSSARLVRSSGNPALDRAAETAIYKASPLPVPGNPSVFAPFRHFTLKMTPQDITH